MNKESGAHRVDAANIAIPVEGEMTNRREVAEVVVSLFEFAVSAGWKEAPGVRREGAIR